MPDQYGNPTEAELRGQGYAPNTLAQPVNVIFDGMIGGRRVQLYGNGPPLSQEQALAYVQNQANRSDGEARNGAMPVDQWLALNPNATAQQIADYKRLNQTYRQGISGTGGVGNSLGNAATFELDHIGNILEGLTDPTRIFGIDPLTTKFGNAVFGTNNEPLVNQMGGATSQQIRDYEAKNGLNSAGGAQGLHNAAAGTAGIIAAGQLAQSGLFNNGSGGPQQLYQGGYNGNFATQTVGMPAAEVGATGAGAGALPEIVVTGTVPSGLTAGQVAGIGAGVGAGLAASGGGAPTNYGDYGGLNDYGGGDLSMGNLADYGAANNGLVLEGGAGTIGGGAMAGIWDDLIPLAGQLIGSYMEGKGAKDASRAQIAAAMAALAEQRRQYDTSRSDQMPWLEAGRAALGRLQDPTAFTKSPGYEFVRSEGNRDINNTFAARGGALSGNALRALDNYNTGLASQEYNNWFNQNASLAGIGQASAQNLGVLGQNNANSASNILRDQGNARASGILGQTDAYTNGLNQLGQWYGNYRRSRQGAY